MSTLARSRLRSHVREVAALVQQLDYCLFTEIAALLQDHIDVEGDGSGVLALNRPGACNVVLWQPCSEQFTQVISEALARQRIFAWPSARQAYGKHALALPLARGALLYREPHWMPVCFRSVQFAETADVEVNVDRGIRANVLRTVLAVSGDVD